MIDRLIGTIDIVIYICVDANYDFRLFTIKYNCRFADLGLIDAPTMLEAFDVC